MRKMMTVMWMIMISTMKRMKMKEMVRSELIIVVVWLILKIFMMKIMLRMIIMTALMIKVMFAWLNCPVGRESDLQRAQSHR